MSEKDLLKYLDGKADGKKVAKAEKKVVVSEEAGETEDTHPKPEPDAAGKSFFFKPIPFMGTPLFKVTATVLSPAPPSAHSPPLTPTLAAARLSLAMVRRVVCVPSQMEGLVNPDSCTGELYGRNVYKCQRYDIGGVEEDKIEV